MVLRCYRKAARSFTRSIGDFMYAQTRRDIPIILWRLGMYFIASILDPTPDFLIHSGFERTSKVLEIQCPNMFSNMSRHLTEWCKLRSAPAYLDIHSHSHSPLSLYEWNPNVLEKSQPVSPTCTPSVCTQSNTPQSYWQWWWRPSNNEAKFP